MPRSGEDSLGAQGTAVLPEIRWWMGNGKVLQGEMAINHSFGGDGVMKALSWGHLPHLPLPWGQQGPKNPTQLNTKWSHFTYSSCSVCHQQSTGCPGIGAVLQIKIKLKTFGDTDPQVVTLLEQLRNLEALWELGEPELSDWYSASFNAIEALCYIIKL